MRRTIVLSSGALALILVFLHSTQAQYNSFPAGPQARNSIPDMITGCYTNFTAYNKFNRRPMHIENLISIIRKIEEKTDNQWDIRRIARTLVNRYMYDGMTFFADARPEFRYRQEPEERAKSMIIKELVRIPIEESFPDGILDNDEKCALHWMLSHSLNKTMREEEMFPDYYGPGGGGYPGNNNGGQYPGNNGQYPGTGYNNNNNNNNGYNNNNNNNPFNTNSNGYNPNPVPTNTNNNNNQMGNSNWRGRRDLSEVSKTGNDTWDFSKATNDSSEIDNKSYEQDDYDVAAENKAKSTTGVPLKVPAPAQMEPKKLQDKVDDDEVDVDVLLSDDSSTSASKSARQVSAQDYTKKTKRPVETGVVYTRWGGVAAGRLISGIAAGLELNEMSVYSGVVSPSRGQIGGPQGLPGSGYNGFGSGTGTGAGAGSGSWNNNNNQNQNGYGTPSKSMTGQGGYPGQYPGSPQYPGGVQQQYPGSSSSGQRYGRKKRQVQNLQPLDGLYAATLAGDGGQAAILNAHNELKSNSLPAGEFNDTVCPRDFILFEQYNGEMYKDSNTWTYLTEAEVRGGLDGFILGANIRRWDPSYTLRLSDILEQYYSQRGIEHENNFRACERSTLMNAYVDSGKLKEQTRSFAYLYNNRTNVISDQKFVQNPSLFETIVNEAYARMEGAARSFNGIGPCQPVNAGTDYNDDQKTIIPKLTIYGVLDHSATVWEIDEQKKFLGQLAYDINVSPTGSRLGVVDGNSGSMIISPNWTDSSSTLACRTVSLSSQMRTQDYARVLTNMKGELERVKSEELRNNYTTSNGVIILFLVQGRKLEENQRNDIIRLTREINEEVYDVTVITTSTKYSESDFNFGEDNLQVRHIRLQQGQGNMSAVADEFAKALLRNTHAALRYMQCNANLYDQDQEHLVPNHLYLYPNTITYYRISADYFYSARALVLRFTSDNGKVRVCYSRKEWYPNANNQENSRVHCKETTGTYVAVGRGEADVEFRNNDLNKPCGKNGKREGCDPIYISITPIEYRGPGQVGLDCSVDACTSSNQVKVTFTHWDMRCNGGERGLLSSVVTLLTVSLALFNWLKST